MRNSGTAWPIAAVLLMSGCFQSEAPRFASQSQGATTATAETRVQTAAQPGMQPAEEADAQSVSALAEMLRNNPDPDVRREAVYALADTGDVADTGFIAQALADPDRNVRRAAIQSLAVTGDVSSTAWLVTALNDADARVRIDAVDALGDIGSLEARTALQQALADPDPEVRAAAAEMLEEPQRSGN